MKHTSKHIILLLFLFITNFSFAIGIDSNSNSYLIDSISQKVIAETNVISSTISGSISVCEGATSQPIITFSATGGTAPYTFIYKLNGVNQPAVVTSAASNTTTISAPTTKPGAYDYSLVSVKDKSGIATTINGTATIVVNPLPDPTINSSAELSVLNGISYFKICSNTIAELTFTNTSTTAATNSNYSIDWGDGTPIYIVSTWSSVVHTYAIGLWPMTYTVTNQFGCSVTKRFDIYVGSNPAVSLGSPGNTDNCSNVPLTFPITGTENNPPGTTYTVTFNDGTPSQTFTHPAPAEITHIFAKTSCGITSYNGTTPYPNSFSASIVASNMCGVSAVNVVPIYISTSPVVDFYTPLTVTSTNKEIVFTNTTTGYVNVGANCAVVPKMVWIITPNTGFTLKSGSLGNDFGQNNSNLWVKGSDVIRPIFTVPGIYKIKLRVDTKRCGDDQIEKTICVEAPLIPQFSVETSSQCTPVIVNAKNATNLTGSCSSSAKWTVNYTSENCGNVPAEWSFIESTNDVSTNPIFNFVTPGTYKVKLSMTNTAGVFSSEQTIVVKKKPTAIIQPIVDMCGVGSIHPVATVNSCAPNSSILTYKWEFSGGIPSSATTLDPGIVNYNSVGTFTAYLTVTNECGSITASSNTFTVNPLPTVEKVPNILKNTGEVLNEIVFVGSENALFDWKNDNPSIGLASSGTGNLPSFLLKNTGNSVSTANIQVTARNILTGCKGIPMSFMIQVNPSGKVDSIPNQVVNNGEFTKKIEFSSEIIGGKITYSWTNDFPEIGLPVSGLGNIDAFIAQNNGNSPLAAKIEVTPIFEFGGVKSVGAKKIFTITVNPTAQVNNVSDIELCNGITLTELKFSTKNSGGTTTYAWTNDNPSIGLVSSGLGDIPSFRVVNKSLNQQFAHISVLPTFTNEGKSNTGQAIQFAIAVNPGALIIDQPVSSYICPNGEVSPLKVVYSGGAGIPTYQWFSNKNKSLLGANLIKDATSNIYLPPSMYPGTSYYFCVISLPTAVCSNLTSDIATVSINEAVVITKQPIKLQNLCVGGSISQPLSIEFSFGSGFASYQWYSNSIKSTVGGAIIPGATDSTYMPPVFNAVGEYYFYVQLTLSGDGCGSVFSQAAEIKVVPDPVIGEQPIATQTICNGTIPTSLSVTATGGLGTYTYQWFENSVNDNFSGKPIPNAIQNVFTPSTLQTGTNYYYCEVSQNSGLSCKVISETAEVIVNTLPIISIQPISSTFCNGYLSEALLVKCLYGVGVPTYQWYLNSSDLFASGVMIPGATKSTYKLDISAVGTSYYYCVINFPEGGCTSLISNIATITINATPKISSKKITIYSGSEFTFSPNESSADFVPTGTNYTWSKPVISPLNSINGALVQLTPTDKISQKLENTTDSIATAFYTVMPVTSSCTGEKFSIEVQVLPTIKSTAIVANSSCFGANNGSINTKITGGMPFNQSEGYTIKWTGPNGFSAGTKYISGLVPGKYLLIITDAHDNSAMFEYLISEPTPIHINTDIKRNVNCAGNNTGKISITVTGGIPPYRYDWKKDSLHVGTTEDISDLEHGVYVLTVTDANGCGLETESYNIIEPNVIDIQLLEKRNILCFGDSTGSIKIEVKGGTPFENATGEFYYNYTWSGEKGFMSFDKNLSKLIAGVYKLIVTDANGCNQTLLVDVTQPAELIVVAEVSPIICYGANNASIHLNISGGTKPYQVNWSNFGSGLLQDNLSAGDYFVSIIDANNCQKTIKIRITEANFSVHPVIKNISCHGANDGSIRLNIAGGIEPIKLLWADNLTAGSTRNHLSPGIYSVTLHDGSACNITESFLISEPDVIQISAKIKNAFACESPTSGAIDVTVYGGTPPYTYQWSNADTHEDLKNLGAGAYFVIVTDSKGCSGNAKFEIFRQLPLSLNLTSTLSFDCTTKKMKKTFKANIDGGFPPYRFNWSSGTVRPEMKEIMETSQNGLVDIIVTDSVGCTANTTFSVDVPSIGISSRPIDCNKFYYQFNAMKSEINFDDLTFHWDFGDGEFSNLNNPTHVFNHTGNFKISLTVSSVSCAATFEETLLIDGKTTLKLDKEPKICIDDSVVLKVSGAYSYRWSDGTYGDSLIVRRTGNYIVIGTTENGCKDTLNFEVTNYDLYNYTIQSDSDKVSSGGFPLHFWSENIPFSQYYWDFGDGNTGNTIDVYHSFKIVEAGYYDVKLTVSNPNGCIENATKRIWITVPNLPNTFSPNGDGINEKFLENWQIKVYSRNGISLFEGREGWDGKYKGQAVSTGIYFYVLYYPGESGTKTTSGYVRVIR